MNKSILLLAFSLFFSLAIGGYKVQATSLYLGAGTSVINEKNDYQNSILRNQKQFLLNVQWTQWLYGWEINQFSESSNVGSLSVQRNVESQFLTVAWISRYFDSVQPFISSGVGVMKESLVTSLSQIGTDDDTGWMITGFGSMGLRYETTFKSTINLFLIFDARLYFGGNYNQQPSTGGGAKLGFRFN